MSDLEARLAKIEAIRELDKARTQGKWEYSKAYKSTIFIYMGADIIGAVSAHQPERMVEDAAFIAACSEAIPNLLDTIDAYQAVLGETLEIWRLAAPILDAYDHARRVSFMELHNPIGIIETALGAKQEG